MPAFPAEAMVLEPACERCPELVASRERIAWGNGPRNADLLIVGEAPGAGTPDAECWQGGNWTGLAYTSRHSGRRIRRMIAQLGYGGNAFYTNAVKCFPAAPSDGTATNREPTSTERSACRDHLRREIGEIDPGVVLTTGRHATVSMLETDGRELDGFLEVVLEPTRCESLDVWMLPILHPSYQDIWIPRLGFEPGAYLDAIEETLDALIDG